jgi:hypothetical protein
VSPDACAFPAGTLSAGAPCGTALQCKSLFCSAAGQTLVEHGGTFMQATGALNTCGLCVDAIPFGGTCQAPDQCTLGCWRAATPCVSQATCIASAPASTTGTCVVCPPISGTTGGGGPFLPTSCPTSSGGTSGSSATSGHVAAGGACDPAASAAPCDPGLLCLNGKCAQGRKIGEACSQDDAGTSDCYGVARCDATTKVCTAPFFPAPGASCGGSSSYLCALGQCSFSLDGGTCPPLLAEGQPCSGQGSSPTGICSDFAQCASPQAAQGCCASMATTAPSGEPAGSAGGPEDGGMPGPDAGSAPGGPTCVFFDPRTCN